MMSFLYQPSPSKDANFRPIPSRREVSLVDHRPSDDAVVTGVCTREVLGLFALCTHA